MSVYRFCRCPKRRLQARFVSVKSGSHTASCSDIPISLPAGRRSSATLSGRQHCMDTHIFHLKPSASPRICSFKRGRSICIRRIC